MKRRMHRLLTVGWCLRKAKVFIVISALLIIFFYARRTCDSAKPCSSCQVENTLFVQRLLLTNRDGVRASGNSTDCVDVHLVTVCVGSNAVRDFVVLLKSILFHRSAASFTRLHYHIVTASEQHHVFRTLLDTWRIPALVIHLYNADEFMVSTLSYGL